MTTPARTTRRAVGRRARRRAPSPAQRADRGVGAGLGGPDEAPVAGRRGAGAARGAPGPRPGAATCAPATRGSPATSTRTTRTRSCSPTTSRRCGPTRSDARVGDGLFRAEGTRGTCRVVCFSPRHDLTLAGMDEAAIRRVVDVWADQTTELGDRYRWVQVFENRGAAMGASNPHPHGQIWAGDALPVEAALEVARQREHLRRDRPRLLLDYALAERGGPRVIRDAGGWLALGAVLGRVAVRDAARARWSPRRASPTSTPAARDGLAGRPARPQPPLRRAVPAAVPVLDGLAPGAVRGTRADDRDADPVERGSSTPTSTRRCSASSVRKFMVGYELLERAAARPDARGGRRAGCATRRD